MKQQDNHSTLNTTAVSEAASLIAEYNSRRASQRPLPTSVARAYEMTIERCSSTFLKGTVDHK